MLTDRARAASEGIVTPIARAVGRAGLSPNALTTIGFLLHAGVGALLADGRWLVGAALLAAASVFDGLDGTLARVTGRASRAGAFLDSVLDRGSEILTFGGVMAYATRAGSLGLTLVALAALTGSLMVSYTRARSEGLGCPTKAGLFGRMERMAVLVVGLALGMPEVTVALIAVGAWVTAAQRIADVMTRCGGEA